MRTAIEDLKLERLWVVYPGKAAYSLTKKVQVIPLADIPNAWNFRRLPSKRPSLRAGARRKTKSLLPVSVWKSEKPRLMPGS